MDLANHEVWMRRAAAVARAGMAAGQTPFGAVIVRAEAAPAGPAGASKPALVEVAAGHNEVWLRGDPTAHAEVVAIQRATAALRTIDLTGCTLYTTCEPCPMCAAAIHWARLDMVVSGANIADAAAAGFHELHLGAGDLYAQGGSPVRLITGVLAAECAALFEAWRRGGGRAY